MHRIMNDEIGCRFYSHGFEYQYAAIVRIVFVLHLMPRINWINVCCRVINTLTKNKAPGKRRRTRA